MKHYQVILIILTTALLFGLWVYEAPKLVSLIALF